MSCAQLKRKIPEFKKIFSTFKQVELDDHLKACQELNQTCNKCNYDFKLREIDTHDCGQMVLRDRQSKQANLAELELKRGSATQLCKKNHKMHKKRGLPYAKEERLMCSECNKPDLDQHPFYFGCEDCDELKCRACDLISKGAIKK
jgi:hypothetical protein